MASKIEIYRAVAAAIGVTPPTDENESTDFVRAISPLWDQVTADFLTRHAWTWGMETREITATANTFPAKWAYKYALPVDRTLVRDAQTANGYPVLYDIQGSYLYCNEAGPLDLVINVSANPGVWPGTFQACVRQTLEGHLWKGLRDEFDRGQALINEIDPPRGDGRLQRMIRIDKRQKPPGRHQRGSVFQAFRNALSPRQSRDG